MLDIFAISAVLRGFNKASTALSSNTAPAPQDESTKLGQKLKLADTFRAMLPDDTSIQPSENQGERAPQEMDILPNPVKIMSDMPMTPDEVPGITEMAENFHDQQEILHSPLTDQAAIDDPLLELPKDPQNIPISEPKAQSIGSDTITITPPSSPIFIGEAGNMKVQSTSLDPLTNGPDPEATNFVEKMLTAIERDKKWSAPVSPVFVSHQPQERKHSLLQQPTATAWTLTSDTAFRTKIANTIATPGDLKRISLPSTAAQTPPPNETSLGGLPPVHADISAIQMSADFTNRELQRGQATWQQTITRLAHPMQGHVEIELSPAELGRISIRIESSDGQARIILQAERPETLEAMRRTYDLFAQDLRDLGYRSLEFQFKSSQGNSQERQFKTAPDPDAQSDSDNEQNTNNEPVFSTPKIKTNTIIARI